MAQIILSWFFFLLRRFKQLMLNKIQKKNVFLNLMKKRHRSVYMILRQFQLLSRRNVVLCVFYIKISNKILRIFREKSLI